MNEVQWLLRSTGSVPPGDGWLSTAEAAQQHGFMSPRRTTEWRLGRWTLKCAVAARLEVPPTGVEIRPTTTGALEAWVDGIAVPLALRVGTRASRAVAITAPVDRSVGCRLELLEAHSDAFMREWLAEDERTRVEGATPEVRELLVNVMWTAKEAAVDALGDGAQVDVRQASVRVPAALPDADGWYPLRASIASPELVLDGWWRTGEGMVLVVLGDTGIPAPTPAATVPAEPVAADDLF